MAAKGKLTLKKRKKRAYLILISQLFFFIILLSLLPNGRNKVTSEIPDPAVIDEPVPPRTIPDNKPKIAFVIDDVGNNIWQLKPFLEVPGPIALAILPGVTHSKDSYEAIVAAGKTAMLHQPMEALGGNDLGPGGIHVADSEETIRQTLIDNLLPYPMIVGINNHMGSKASADPRTMRIVAQVLKEKGLFFVDSRTNSQSVIGQIAQEYNIPYAERAVFLDNEQNRDYILEALEDARTEAKKTGHAVVIGHVWTQELADILMDVYPQLIEEGYSLVEIQEILLGRSVY
ncbi:divergent polysaccharide deacetylase family protein [Spirochaeta cellobiosiphila]|uniref:divergent polysaccharide deacetylase family protein n=1 Tax=Spirochaeta cellobiosiphila TaxID=504483 RepID=UPI000412B1F5|nr:divergent polysaccharide deacetylase family protein [Spirochaeta cellobiosiphila]